MPAKFENLQRQPLLLYVTDAESIGGAEGYLRTLLLNANQERYRVGLLLPGRPGTQPLVAECRAHGIEVAYFDHIHKHGLSLAAILRAARLLRKLGPSIIHFVLPSPRRAAETIIAAWLVGVPRRLVTFQLVTPIPRFGRLAGWARALNRQLQFATLHHGIVVSERNRRLLVEQYNFPTARLALIPNAVNSQQFSPTATSGNLREQWAIPSDALLIGVVGRLSRQKGHEILLAALPNVWEAFPQTHVVLIGSGELEDKLRTQAAQVDAIGRVHLVGQQQQMPQALAALDLFVLPSLYEGLPFALLEALAMERAVVATAVDGTVEVIEHGRNGLLVPPGAVEPLADAIISLLGDAALRSELGRTGRRTIAERFEERQMLEQTFALYEQD